VLATNISAALQALVRNWYGSETDPTLPNATFNGAVVPSGWLQPTDESPLYNAFIKPIAELVTPRATRMTSRPAVPISPGTATTVSISRARASLLAETGENAASRTQLWPVLVRFKSARAGGFRRVFGRFRTGGVPLALAVQLAEMPGLRGLPRSIFLMLRVTPRSTTKLAAATRPERLP
jgi:hypothetical protein